MNSSSANTKPKRIACALPAGIVFFERILKGVLDYAREHAQWTFVRLPERLDPTISWLKSCPCDGALVVIHNQAAADVVHALHVPVVNLTAYTSQPEMPTVMVDQSAIGRMTAMHLLERRFTQFAYYGTKDLWYSNLRRQAFAKSVRDAGYPCAIHEVPSYVEGEAEWNAGHDNLDQWLSNLPLPVGIMASTDLRASMITDACVRVGLRIPQDVCLIGVDNDPMCEFNNPPLSSVSRNDTKVGWEAAALLDHLMQGGAAPIDPILVAPDQVVTRESSNTLAVKDPRIAKAISYVQKNVHRPFGVEQLIEISGMRRRGFEVRFAKELGITAHAFINQSRVNNARHLLEKRAEASLTEVAALSGFRDLRRFRIVFQQHMGIAPAAFRKQAVE